MNRKYKRECIDELKRYIDIAADECCKECEICCESNNCILTKIKDGMANVFGIEIGKGSYDMTGVDFYHYFGNEHMRFSIDKLEDDDVVEIGEVIGKFRDFLEAMMGYEIDEDVVVKYWRRI